MNAVAKKPSHPITVETFRPEYTKGIGELISSIQQQEFNIEITLNDQPDLNNIPAAYQQNGGNFWMALENGELIGTIALLNAGDTMGVIRKMFVRKDKRGSGIAQELLDTLMDWAKIHGFSTLYLGTIDKLEAAIRFYERNGFSYIPNDKLPDAVKRIRMKVDTRHYYKDIAP